uniref:REJ domain-containing protein n=1 Tax=Angiostrongylus cantonensis TaxID=6313 RepID=A0A0K0D6A0_ANGCA
MVLDVSLKRAEPTGLLLLATGENRGFTGARSSHWTINGTTGDTDPGPDSNAITLPGDSCVNHCAAEALALLFSLPFCFTLAVPSEIARNSGAVGNTWAPERNRGFESGLDFEFWKYLSIIVGVFNSDDDFLGTIYLDVGRRPRKAFGDCHFTVRCSKQLGKDSWQTPIVVLSLSVCDETDARWRDHQVMREILCNPDGECIPVEDAASMIASRFAFSSLEIMQQVRTFW